MCEAGVFNAGLKKCAPAVSGLSADQVTRVSGESSDRVQRFKRWFWSVVEKMNNIERQDLVSTVSKAPLPSASSLFRSCVATWAFFVVFMAVCVCMCMYADVTLPVCVCVCVCRCVTCGWLYHVCACVLTVPVCMCVCVCGVTCASVCVCMCVCV